MTYQPKLSQDYQMVYHAYSVALLPFEQVGLSISVPGIVIKKIQILSLKKFTMQYLISFAMLAMMATPATPFAFTSPRVMTTNFNGLLPPGSQIDALVSSLTGALLD